MNFNHNFDHNNPEHFTDQNGSHLNSDPYVNTQTQPIAQTFEYMPLEIEDMNYPETGPTGNGEYAAEHPASNFYDFGSEYGVPMYGMALPYVPMQTGAPAGVTAHDELIAQPVAQTAAQTAIDATQMTALPSTTENLENPYRHPDLNFPYPNLPTEIEWIDLPEFDNDKPVKRRKRAPNEPVNPEILKMAANKRKRERNEKLNHGFTLLRDKFGSGGVDFWRSPGNLQKFQDQLKNHLLLMSAQREGHEKRHAQRGYRLHHQLAKECQPVEDSRWRAAVSRVDLLDFCPHHGARSAYLRSTKKGQKVST